MTIGKTTILKKLSDEDITHIMPTQGSFYLLYTSYDDTISITNIKY